jgi:hypothetical protein
VQPDENEIPSLESKMTLFGRLIKSSKAERIKRSLPFAVIALVAISSLYLANRLTTPVGNPHKSNAATLTSSVESVAISTSNSCSSSSGVTSNCTLNTSPTVVPDPNNVCESNRGDQTNCEKAGCQYYPSTKSCVVKENSDFCTPTASLGPCDSKTVGTTCNNPSTGTPGVCGHSIVYRASSDYCACKTPNKAIFLAENGAYCPTNSGGCMCNLQLIAPGAYCALHINNNEYCSETAGCLCTDISGHTFTIASAAQCTNLTPGLQQWVDRTNALRLSCSTGSSTPAQCAGLGLYQIADVVTLGQLSSTNTAVQAYITCTQQLIAGTRTDCLPEAISLGANATFVADAFVGVAKLAVTAPQIVRNSIDSLSSVISKVLTGDVANSQGVITKELFGTHYAELLKICGTCDNPVDLLTFLKEERVTLGAGDGLTSWGSVQQSAGKVVDLSTLNSTLPLGNGSITFDLNYATDPAIKSMYDSLNFVPRQLDDMPSTFINTPGKVRIQIVVHGTPDYIVYNGANYYADDFANLLKANGYNPSVVQSIDLISCNTAQSCSIIRPSFAENLSNQLEVPVTAPTTQAQFNPGANDAIAVTVNPNGSLQFGVWTTFFPAN